MWERHIDQLPPSCTWTGGQAGNPGMCPDQESAGDPLLCGAMPNQLSPTGQGPTFLIHGNPVLSFSFNMHYLWFNCCWKHRLPSWKLLSCSKINSCNFMPYCRWKTSTPRVFRWPITLSVSLPRILRRPPVCNFPRFPDNANWRSGDFVHPSGHRTGRSALAGTPGASRDSGAEHIPCYLPRRLYIERDYMYIERLYMCVYI